MKYIFVCYRPNHILKALLYSYYNGTKEDLFVIGSGEVESTSILAKKLNLSGYNILEIDYMKLQQNIFCSKKYAKTIINLINHKSISRE